MKHEIDLKNYQVRTDLISEVIEKDIDNKGYHRTEEKIEEVLVETIKINKEGESIFHKKQGLYKTIYFDDVTDEKNFEKVLHVLEKVVSDMLLEEKI